MLFEILSLGIDLGGSHVSCVVINEQGHIIDKNNTPVRRSNDGIEISIENILRLITSSAKELINKYPACKSVGIGIPGNVDPTTGTTRYLPNYGWLAPVSIGAYLETELGCIVRMRNDGRCAAIAESKFGVGRSSKVFAMLTLGTGIGGALIIDGVLFDGSTYDAGDFGHHVICSGDDAFDCVCGKKGCFEYHASADGLVRHYHRELSRSTRHHGGGALISSVLLKNNAEEVIALVRENDDIAKQALRRYKEDLSHGLANLITFYNPDTIAIGGGLSQASEIFEGLTQLVDAKTLPATRDKVIILPASLSVDAGPIGAALVGLYCM